MFTDLFESIADMVQAWSESTRTVVFLVLVAFTFHFFARCLMGLKSDSKISNWRTIMIFFVCFALLMLYIASVNY